MKKWIKPFMITYFLLQLAVPGYVVYRHYDTLHKGEDYKFAVELYDPYDPFRGRYVALIASQHPPYSYEDHYGVLTRDQDGYAVVTSWEWERPTFGPYVKNLKLERYFMNEKLAPKAEFILRTLEEEEDIYLLVKVKQGHYVIEGLYMNGIPMEEYLLREPG